MKKYTTLAIPVELSEEFKKVYPDIQLSFFCRATVRNMLNLCKRYSPEDVLQVFMFSDVVGK